MTPTNTLDQEIDTLMQSIHKKIQSPIRHTKYIFDNLTVLQVQALRFIHTAKSITTTDLSRIFEVSKPSASALVERLVEHGWIKRTPHTKDRRTILLTLTKKANKRLDEICEQRSNVIKNIFQSLNPEEKQNLVRILKKMNDSLK